MLLWGYTLSFIADCDALFFTDGEPDLVVPYNLNLRLLQRLSGHFGWGSRMFTGTISSIGHLFCSDVFYNLTQILPYTKAERIFCFAAGMGATFAGLLIERCPHHLLPELEIRGVNS